MESISQITTPWHVYDLLSEAQFQQYAQAGIEAIHAQLLHNRGIVTPQAMRSFLDVRYDQTPDPLALIDMDRALERVQRALTQREHITVYGDYDADGVTSSALLTRALRALKQPEATLDFHIPSRVHDGCGLNLKAIDLLKSRGTSLIITTDCGSSDVEQVAYAQALGIDVIITDHHHPPQQRPAAFAMINPWRPDCAYSERYLCGVGIAFKLAQALYRAYKRPAADELFLLDLVAVGTIADVAPLLGENHTLVRLGLQQLNETRNPGLLALLRKAGLPVHQPGRIRERDIAYALAPRINAAGRMKDASIAFKLLTTDDAAEAAQYVEELEQLNQSRQRQTEELMNHVRAEAQFRPNDKVVLVSGDHWPEGIIGLVAGKLSEEINRPVLVLSRGPEFSRGSARSQQGLNIIDALGGCADILVRYGGHAQAAGFTIANNLVENLRERLLNWNGLPRVSMVAKATGETAAAEIVDQTGVVVEQETSGAHMVDLVFKRLERVNYHMYRLIRELAPFGAANPEPAFKIEGLRILSSWSSGFDGRNLRLLLGNGNIHFKGTMMRGGPRRSTFPVGQAVDVIFSIEPAWNPAEDASKQEIWLKILRLELVDRTQ
ncbi:MAG TPA: single-stranded-DNA-specific exonuclease RecJ [Ktedonobacteraceae bacterium]|nr:single-stranded-DNA-specific exonuclease RecJ [Ktedonobacteraceae bacterium]